jgi:cell division protein FtsW (lipid II flippase)
VNRPEIIALIIIGLSLFLLVKYTAVQWWHVLVILVAGFFLAVYVPQVPSLISGVAGWLSSHATALTYH